MGSPTTINPPAQTVDGIISEAIYSAALPAAETALIAQFPFLGFPVVKPIFEAVLKYIAGIIFTQLANGGTKIVITIQTDKEKAVYSAAEGALRAAQLSGNPAQLKQATEAFKVAVQNLIHFDGGITS